MSVGRIVFSDGVIFSLSLSLPVPLSLSLSRVPVSTPALLFTLPPLGRFVGPPDAPFLIGHYILVEVVKGPLQLKPTQSTDLVQPEIEGSKLLYCTKMPRNN